MTDTRFCCTKFLNGLLASKITGKTYRNIPINRISILPFEWMSDSSEEIIVIRVHLFERLKQLLRHMVENVSRCRKLSTPQISKKPYK